MSNFSKGIISIPEVTGDIEITVTTQGQAINLFDTNTALYNHRVKSTGAVSSDSANGIITTAPIDISNISTLTIGGISEVYNTSYGYCAYIWTYSDADASTMVSSLKYTAETYVMDVANIKQSYPTGVYCRVVLALTNGTAVSQADTTNLTIYGS